MQASPETPEELRHAFGHLPSGVVAVCALVGGRPVGMAASSFVPVSLKPPLVSFCAARTSRTWQALRQAPSLGVSVLAEDHAALCRALASSAEDRFADVRWEAGESGAVFLPGTVLVTALIGTLITLALGLAGTLWALSQPAAPLLRNE